jgi:hypothetical protein
MRCGYYFSLYFDQNCSVLTNFSKIPQISNFMKICSAVLEMLDVDKSCRDLLDYLSSTKL